MLPAAEPKRWPRSTSGRDPRWSRNADPETIGEAAANIGAVVDGAPAATAAGGSSRTGGHVPTSAGQAIEVAEGAPDVVEGVCRLVLLGDEPFDAH